VAFLTGPKGGFTLFKPAMIQRNRGVRRAMARAVAAAAIAFASAAAVSAAGPSSLSGAGSAAAAADAVLYRVFLKDGGVLVSYGEFASVADKVVLSMPIGGTEAAPVLHLISIPEKDVEWERTNAYAQAARARHYIATQAENDFSRLTREVADTLYRVGSTQDPAQRLSLAENARQQLVEWPQHHYGYRADELGQMTTWLDQVVSELRVAAGKTSFDLALVASGPAPVVPNVEMLPAPSFRERLELGFAASRLTTDPAQRTALLRAVLDVLAPSEGPEFKGSWMEDLRLRATKELAAEVRVDNAYAALRTRALGRAAVFQKRADVRGLQGVVQWVLSQDARLERARPADVEALLATLDVKLDAARRYRLALDTWTVRTEIIKRYWTSVRYGLDQFLAVRQWLTDIRQLAGPSPGALRQLNERLALAQRELAKVQPPPEVAIAHSTLVAAAGLAVRAAASRFAAVRSGNMDTAWEASSAAAGSLMMLDQAIAELRKITHAPQPTR
jgi:hypothetical protein